MEKKQKNTSSTFGAKLVTQITLLLLTVAPAYPQQVEVDWSPDSGSLTDALNHIPCGWGALCREYGSLGADAIPAGGVLRLSPGLYHLGETLHIDRDNLTLEGAGAGATVLLVDACRDGIRIEGQAASFSRAGTRLRNLTLKSSCANPSHSGVGVTSYLTGRLELEGVEISGFQGAGIYAEESLYLNVSGADIHNNGIGVLLADGVQGSALLTSRIHHNHGDGVRLTGPGQGRLIQGGVIEGNGGWGVNIGSSPQQQDGRVTGYAQIYATRLEANQNGGILIDSLGDAPAKFVTVSGVSIVSSHFGPGGFNSGSTSQWPAIEVGHADEIWITATNVDHNIKIRGGSGSVRMNMVAFDPNRGGSIEDPDARILLAKATGDPVGSDDDAQPIDVADGSSIRSVYGNPVAFSSLANTNLTRRHDVQVEAYANRVRVPRDGQIIAIRKPFIWDPPNNYGGGDGGVVRFEVVADDAVEGQHLPSDQKLGETLAFRPLDDLEYAPTLGKAETTMPSVPLTAPVSVKAGQIVHVVVLNESTDPETDFIALNDVSDYCAADEPQRSPHLGADDLRVALKVNDAPWSDTVSQREYFTASVELLYADGSATGMGYMEAGSQRADGKDPCSETVASPGQSSGTARIVSGPAGVREVFTVSGGDRVVDALWVRALRRSGNAPLEATLRQRSTCGGAVKLRTLTAGAQQSPIGGRGVCGSWFSNNAEWFQMEIEPPIVLTAGESYDLEFRTDPSTVYRAPVVRDGHAAGWGFHQDTVFSDGHAEYTLDGQTWRVWDTHGLCHDGTTTGKDQDLQFFFEVR